MKIQSVTVFLVLGLLIFSTIEGIAQRKVLGKPQDYVTPIDYFDNPSEYQIFLRSRTSPKLRKDAWLVFSDRNNNPIYDRPNGTKIGEIMFRDYFYVIDEKEDWIRLVEGRVDGRKIDKHTERIIGWVKKENMLLWNSGLVHRTTRIHKKILLLNLAEEINEVLTKKDKKLVKIFRSPDAIGEEPDKQIFEFYFLLKKEKGMYLLSEEAVIDPSNSKKIIGWVRDSDCTTWDTRICLEPNFTKEGFDERLETPRKRIRAYKSLEGAIEGAKGNIEEDKVFWDFDPVLIERDELAETDPRRFKGPVIRFPMISNTTIEDVEYYRTGLVGNVQLKAKDGVLVREIPENRLAQLKKQENELLNKSQKVNFFFIIEGTKNVDVYRQPILKAINEINSEVARKIPSVKFGALVYRDVPEERVDVGGQFENRLIEFQPLTDNVDNINTFLSEEVEFKNRIDRDDYTSLYYGVFQALQKAGLRDDELNVIMLLGCYGDFRTDRDRRKAAKDHPALFSNDDINRRIVANLDKLNAHLYVVQLLDDGYSASAGFSKACQYMMLENAKFAFNRSSSRLADQTVKQLESYGYSAEAPSMEFVEGEEETFLDGHIPGSLYKAPRGRKVHPSKLSSILVKNAQTSIDFIQSLKTVVSFIITEGRLGTTDALQEMLGRDVGPLKKALVDKIAKILEENPLIDPPDLLDEKYALFTEVYIPYKNKYDDNPLVSYVLFMPESDLLDYKRTIERCRNSLGTTDYSVKREMLFEVYKSLVGQFAGEKLHKRSIKDITRKELRDLMQGIYGLGLHLEEDLDHVIGDVLDEKRMTNPEIDTLIQRFVKIDERLEAILREGSAYDFCYETDGSNRYYWIKIVDAF